MSVIESKEERPNAEKRERKIGQSEPATQTALEAPETCASSADSSEPTANKQPNKKSKPKKSEVKVDPPIDEEPEPVHPNMMKLEEEPAKVRDKKKSLWNKVRVKLRFRLSYCNTVAFEKKKLFSRFCSSSLFLVCKSFL